MLHRIADIGQLADSGRLDDDVVRVELLHNLLQCFGKVTDQAAADAARIHLSDVDACFLKETAVDTDLTEFIFDQDNLLSCKHIADKLLDQRRLSCSKETGNNINFCHVSIPSFFHAMDQPEKQAALRD